MSSEDEFVSFQGKRGENLRESETFRGTINLGGSLTSQKDRF